MFFSGFFLISPGRDLLHFVLFKMESHKRTRAGQCRGGHFAKSLLAALKMEGGGVGVLCFYRMA